MDAVIAGERREAEIGNDEPLGRKLAVVVAAGALGRRRHHIDPGLQVAERLIDRECGRDILIERGRRGQFARPDFHAPFVAEAGKLVFVEGALEIAVDHGVDQIAVADPKHVDGHRRGVDADQRNAALAGARQHIGPPGEAHERLAVADIDVELGRFRQALLHRGRQAGAQHDIVALAVLEAIDAKLPFLRRQRRLVAAREREERREVGPLGEVLGELEAGARRGRVGIHGVVEQPEAMLVAHFFVAPAHIGDLAQIERQPQRIERRTPQLALGHRPAEHRQRIGLVGGVAGTLIGDVGRGRGTFQQEGLLAAVGRADLEDGAGKPQPVGAVVGRGGGDLPEDLQAGAEIAAPEGGVGIGPQARPRLGDRTGLALDLGFQLDRGIGEVVASESLVRRLRRNEAKRQRGAKCRGANQTDHDGAPWRR